MSSDLSHNLALRFMQASRVDKESIFNELVRVIDVLLQGQVLSQSVLDPRTLPTDHPVDGDAWIINGVGLHEWAGHDHQVVFWYDGWSFVDVPVGTLLWVHDLAVPYRRQTYTTWVAQSSTVSKLDDLSDVIIGTALQDGQVLRWIGSLAQWEPETIKTADHYDVGLFIPGTPLANSLVAQHILAVGRSFRLPIGASGSVARCEGEPAGTADTTFAVFKNTTQIGSIRFSAGSNTGTFFNFTTAQTFVASDRIKVVAPAHVDDHLSDLTITFAGLNLL